MGRVRLARGADRGLRRQARRPAARVDGRALRLVATALSAGGSGEAATAPGTTATFAAIRARAARLEADVCRAAGVAPGGRAPPALDRARRSARPGAAAARRRRPRDDDLAARLSLGRRRPGGGTRGGDRSRRRWAPRRVLRPSAGSCAATGTGRRSRSPGSSERIATAGDVRRRLAGRSSPTRARSSRRPSTARRSWRPLGLVAPGNAPGHPGRHPVRRQGAVARSGWPMRSPRPAARSAVRVASPGRARRLDRGRGPRSAASRSRRAPPRRSRSGSAASSTSTTSSAATRPGSPRPSSTSWPSTAADAPITARRRARRSSPRRCRGRSGRSPTPSASGAARPRSQLLDRLLDDHARAGAPGRAASARPRAARARRPAGRRRALAAAAKAMGIASEFRAQTLAAQARRWSTEELTAALDGLRRARCHGQGRPGSGQDDAQRRLAFSLWVMDHVHEPAGTDGATWASKAKAPARTRSERTGSA